jgi:tRNA(adenine34) deaminase
MIDQNIDEECIERCLKLAEHSLKNGDYYFGALITYRNKIIIEANNTVQQDITGHAEINAMKKLTDEFPDIDPAECTLYSSLEPCGMCSFLIRDIGMGRVVFSAPSPYMGGYTRWDILTTSNLHSRFTIGGRSNPPKITPYVLKDKSTRILDDLNWEMHRSPHLSQRKTENIIKKIASEISEDYAHTVKQTFEYFAKIPSENRHVYYLRDRVKAKYPKLFDKATGAVRLSDYTQFVTNTKKANSLVHINNPQTMQKEAKKLKNELLELFPIDKYTHSSRISTTKQIAEKLQQNGPRGKLDSIGHRIVPKDSSLLSDAIKKFENNFSSRINYKLNILALNDDEFYSILSKSSSLNYRAIHYYITVGDCIAEVQFRTASTDAWASIHHETLYKPKREISVAENRAIENFGVIANIVDYNKILGVKY